MSAVKACWYVSVSTDVLQSPLQWSDGPIIGERDPQEVLVSLRALDLLRETFIEDDLQQEGEKESDRERVPIVSPTRTTVWSSNNPIQVVKFSYFYFTEITLIMYVTSIKNNYKSTLFSLQTTCTQCMYADKNFERFSV